jgi:hypothetical protein
LRYDDPSVKVLAVTQQPDISQVIRYLYNEANKHERKASELNIESLQHAGEAKTFRKLAEEMEAKFPSAKMSNSDKGPMLTNLPVITFEELQKRLEEKAGRVKHVAQRLNISETLVRDLINAPNSRFYIGAKGWIYPKTKDSV